MKIRLVVVLIVILAMLLFSGCGGETVTPDDTQTTLNTLLDTFDSGMASGDVDKVMGCLTDDINVFILDPTNPSGTLQQNLTNLFSKYSVVWSWNGKLFSINSNTATMQATVTIAFQSKILPSDHGSNSAGGTVTFKKENGVWLISHIDGI